MTTFAHYRIHYSVYWWLTVANDHNHCISVDALICGSFRENGFYAKMSIYFESCLFGSVQPLVFRPDAANSPFLAASSFYHFAGRAVQFGTV